MEIKFRAWDTDNQRMVDCYSVQELMFLRGLDVFHCDTLIPMQYTGLKDKNGVEGYHRDILNNGFEDNWLIEWDENQGNYHLKSLLGYEPLPLRKMKGMVIIGNIYEDGHLLNNSEL